MAQIYRIATGWEHNYLMHVQNVQVDVLALMEMKLAWHSLAIALARRVFPQPGGP